MLRANNIPLSTLAILMIVSTLIAAPFDNRHLTLLPTYFTYTEEEVAPLYTFDSSKEMNKDELAQWDKTVFELISKEKQEENSSRIYAYLYSAQRDAAYLSYNIKQRFEGSLNPVSRKVLTEFFPNFTEQQKERQDAEDAYSDLLADIVLTKVKARIAEDRRSIKPYEQKKGPQYWVGEKPFYGLSTGSWKPWFLSSGNQFRVFFPPPYESPEWQEQIKLVKKACENITENQKKTIFYWAGIGPGESSQNQNGDWRKIANDYMWSHDAPLRTMLLVRSILAMGVADAGIAVFDSKYTYWTKRPSMRDSTIKIHLPNPNHPSYPAGHSTVSNTAATILSYFFPQERSKWEQLAREAGVSRIWCGIHFPLDIEAGKTLGKNVGRYVVEATEKNGNSEKKTAVSANL
jgi:membrane-associated phospholipid phosphatase